MRIVFFVNDIASEKADYTTTWLMREALRRGHDAYYVGVEDFSYSEDDLLRVRCRTVSGKRRSNEKLLADLAGDDAEVEWLPLEEMDILFLRSNPADEKERPWAQSVGYIFGEVARQRGVLVLNDPEGLAKATNKLYFQTFPREVRPRTLIARDREAIRDFVGAVEGDVVIKPLQGSGGTNVFLVRADEEANLNQMMDAVLRDGYLVAQEYLPAAAEGDTRLVLMNGDPLRVGGHYCAYRRRGSDGDMRSNLTAGGKLEKVKIGERELRIAEIVKPRLVQDGMFLVGLDIAGDKVMEINVFTPGGVGGAELLYEEGFSGAVLDALERKVAVRERYRGDFSNRQLAML